MQVVVVVEEATVASGTVCGCDSRVKCCGEDPNTARFVGVLALLTAPVVNPVIPTPIGALWFTALLLLTILTPF